MLKLERIQYAALRIALGYCSSTPINIILGDSRLCMLQHRAKYLCNRFIMVNLSNSGSTSYNWLTDSTTLLCGVIQCVDLTIFFLDKLKLRCMKENCSKRKKTTHETYSTMNTIYFFQQYLFILKWVISSKMLRTRTPYSLLTSATDPLTTFPSLLIAVRMRYLVE